MWSLIKHDLSKLQSPKWILISTLVQRSGCNHMFLITRTNRRMSSCLCVCARAFSLLISSCKGSQGVMFYSVESGVSGCQVVTARFGYWLKVRPRHRLTSTLLAVSPFISFVRIDNYDYYSFHVLNRSVCHNNAFICYSHIVNQTCVLSFFLCFCSSIDL